MKWPDNRRIAVMLAFDLDAETLWEAYQDRDHPSNMSRGAYGPVQGMPRILTMLDKYLIRTTFFVPARTALRYPDLIRDIASRGHEIGYHGYEHASSPDRDQERENMLRAEQLMQKLTGQRLRVHRAPSGSVYDYTLPLLLERGYIASSNWRNTDGPFIHRLDGREIPLVELPKDSIFDDTAYDMYIERPIRPWHNLRSGRDFVQVWLDEFDALAAEGRMINFVLHPQFIGRVSRLNALDQAVAYMLDNGAWFDTNGNVARYILREHGHDIDG